MKGVQPRYASTGQQGDLESRTVAVNRAFTATTDRFTRDNDHVSADEAYAFTAADPDGASLSATCPSAVAIREPGRVVLSRRTPADRFSMLCRPTLRILIRRGGGPDAEVASRQGHEPPSSRSCDLPCLERRIGWTRQMRAILEHHPKRAGLEGDRRDHLCPEEREGCGHVLSLRHQKHAGIGVGRSG